MALPEWQKRDWVDVPPGTTAPAGAPARDAAWHTTLDDFLGAVPGAVETAHTRVICTSTTRPAEPPTGLKIYETDTILELVNTGTSTVPVWEQLGGGGGGQPALSTIPVNNVLAAYAEVHSEGTFYAQVFSPSLGDLRITGVRVHGTVSSGPAHSAVLRRIENIDRVSARYAAWAHLIAIKDFVGSGNASEDVLFDAPVDLVPDSIYEIGIGVDPASGIGSPGVAGGPYTPGAVSGIRWGYPHKGRSRSGVENHYSEVANLSNVTMLCTQSGVAHTVEPATIADPYYSYPVDPAGQLTLYLPGRQTGSYPHMSYELSPGVAGVSVTGVIAEATPSGAALEVAVLDSAGAILSQVAFTGDGLDQTLTFPSPAALTQGQTYSVLYRATASTSVAIPCEADVGFNRGNADISVLESYYSNNLDGSLPSTIPIAARMKLLYSVT